MKSLTYNIKLWVVAVAALFATTSCLEKYPDSAILEDKAMHTYDDAEQLVTGIYAMFKSGALHNGYLTLLPDIQTDMVYAIDGYSNQYGSFWLWQIRSTTSEVESVYAGLYSVISNCNYFLENIDGVKANTYDDAKLTSLDYYTGEVYTLRALAYSELLKLYCEAYDPMTAKDKMGVVLRKHYSKAEVAERASLYDSYQFVLEDLAKAEELLNSDYDQYSSDYATKALAEALHARVALYMQDWEEAIKYSTSVIENRAFSLSPANVLYTDGQSYFQYMWNYDLATEVIWRVRLTPQSPGAMIGSAFVNFTNDYVNFYPDYVPAQWVLNLYAQNDLRYNAYFYQAQTGYTHGLVWPLLVKYYGNGDFINSYKLYHVSMPKPFRLAEQYLIRAEAYCRKDSPNYSAASADLTALRESRFKSGTGGLSVSESNFMQHIAEERVRELYMEGHRLHDIKRWGKLYNNGKGFERTPQSNSLVEGSSIKKSADDYMYVWPIPRHEIEAPGSKVKQNVGY
ncbi:MAG: RagB/SusD family nutrient uptake outer membrane protein [Alistipes sp.]|nr:RagB/SusD family nutrient uptake outer membrane protein [Alistipes sp.]